jgi:hypothetical protein
MRRSARELYTEGGGRGGCQRPQPLRQRWRSVRQLSTIPRAGPNSLADNAVKTRKHGLELRCSSASALELEDVQVRVSNWSCVVLLQSHKGERARKKLPHIDVSLVYPTTAPSRTYHTRQPHGSQHIAMFIWLISYKLDLLKKEIHYTHKVPRAAFYRPCGCLRGSAPNAPTPPVLPVSSTASSVATAQPAVIVTPGAPVPGVRASAAPTPLGT